MLNIGVTKRQAQVISYETEKDLWDHSFLGEDTPDKLRNTALFDWYQCLFVSN